MQNNNNKYLLINYFCIAVILLHPIFVMYINIDGQGRLPFIATLTLSLVSLIIYGKKTFAAPYIFWWLWAVYAIINTTQTGGIQEDPQMFYVNSVLCSAIVMTVSAVEFQRDAKKFLKFLTVLLLVYALLGLKDFSFSLGVDNMDMWEHSISDLGNMLPITLVFLGFIVILSNKLNAIKKKYLIAILILIIGIIITAATRKAFGAIVIVFVFSIMSRLLQSPSKSIKYILVLAIGYIAVNYLLENSFLGNRFAMAQESAMDSEFSNNFFLSAMGDRAIMYVEGWKIFLENPLTGIGLTHFMNVRSLGLLLHTEYMVQLTECGIIGSLLFIALYAAILNRLIKALKIKNMRDYTYTCIGVVTAILFMSFTAWTYQFPIYFITLGIVIGYTETVLKKQQSNYN